MLVVSCVTSQQPRLCGPSNSLYKVKEVSGQSGSHGTEHYCSLLTDEEMVLSFIAVHL